MAIIHAQWIGEQAVLPKQIFERLLDLARRSESVDVQSADDDMGPFDALLAALRQPYAETADNARYAEPAPADVTAGYQTFCGT